MKELRTLNPSALRRLCIKHNWYTRGDTAAYSNLLSFVESKKNLTTDDIVIIANDIIKHSTVEHEITEHEITFVCFEIARKCISYFVAE